MAKLIDNIVDEGAIKKQLDNLEAQLNKTATTLGTCALKTKEFSDAFGNAKGISDIIALTEKYNQTITLSQKAQNDLVNQEKQRADTLLKLQQIQESNAKVELLNAQAAAATAKAQAEATKAEQARTQSSEKQATQAAKASQAELALQTAEKALIDTLKQAGISVDKLNVSKSQAISVNKLLTTINTSEKGSHEQLAAQYDLNYKAYNKLSSIQRDSSAGKAMAESLGSQSTVLKDMEGKLGNFTRQVGDYKNQILGALGANQGFIGNLANMAMGAEKSGESFGKAGASGVKAFGTAMWDLMKNPIVLTLAAIAAIFMLVKAAIDSNGEATNKLNQAMASLKTILAWVLNIVSELVVVFLDSIIAIEKFANVIMSVIPGLDKIAEKNLQAIELEKQKQELVGKSRQLMVDEAKTHEQTTELMTKARQKDRYSIAERLIFMQTADAAELDLNKRKVEHAQESFDLIKKEMENEGKSYLELTSEKKDAYKKAEADIYAVQEEYFQKTRRLHAQEATLVIEAQKEVIDSMKTTGDAQIEAWKVSQNTANMNSKQKIAYEKEYANKVINLQQDMNKQRIEDQKKNAETGLNATRDELYKKYDEAVKAAKKDTNLSVDQTKDKLTKIDNVLRNKTREAEETSKKETDTKIKLINDENALLESQRTENQQKAISEYESYQVSLLSKQNESGLLKLKADSNYNSMTFEQKTKFDVEYFVQDQSGKQKVLDLQKKYSKITVDEYKIGVENLKSEQKLFTEQQAQVFIKHYEQVLSEEKSFKESEIKVNQNYGDKSIGYQQQITRQLFEIQADLDTRLAEEQFKNKLIDETVFKTKLNTVKAQRAALLEAQREGSENNEHALDMSAITESINRRKKYFADMYSEGKMSAEEYEKEIHDITVSGEEQTLRVEIIEDKKKLENDKIGYDQRIAIGQDIAKKEEQLATKHANVKLQREKELQKKIVDLIKASAAAIQTIGDDQFQGQLDKIAALKTANSDAATKETEEITKKLNSGILSKQEADAQSAAIDAQKLERDKQLDQQTKEMQRKQAVFDKETAVFTIALDTALAIMKDTKGIPWPANIPIIAADAALGAIELAAVLAKPLPAYAFGVNDHIGGDAIVGDAFRHEMAVTPSGQIIKTPDIPTVMNLPAHTKVFPDYDKALQEMAFKASISSMNATVPKIEINAYNDALMRKTMGALVSNTEKQTGILNNLKKLDALGDVVSTNLKIVEAIKSNKKNPWVN